MIRILSAWRSCMSTKARHTVIRMPALSPTMTQGNIVKYQKQIGDKLSAGQVLLEIETDKAQMDFEYNDDDGYVAAYLQKEGAKDVPVGAPLVLLAQSKEEVDQVASYANEIDNSSAIPAIQNVESEEKPENTFIKTEKKVLASPAARFQAKSQGIDLTTIQGSGPNGRRVLRDLETTFVDTPVSAMRKVIASRLCQSKSTIPHYYLTVRIKMDRLLQVREKLKESGIQTSVNDFVVKAAALALQRVPAVNSAWIDGPEPKIRQYKASDISVAVATENGLITPIIFNAHAKNLVQIALETRELANKARSGSLKPSEFQGGSFTISNLGMFGIEQFSAIINPPQAAILAVGAITEESPSLLHATISCDHRVIDGAVGAAFMQEFKKLMQEPLEILVH